MATLTSALNYALSGLSVAASQSALVSRNVSSAGDENYTRKSAEIRSLPGGGPVVSGYVRSTDKQLLDKLLASTSAASGQQVVLDALNRLSALSGDPQSDSSVAAKIGAFQESLRSLETNPSDMSLASSAVEQARGVTDKINASATEITQLRTDADQAMGDSVNRVGSLLAQFKVANDSIVRGQGTPGELTDALDQRDNILKLLSEDIGIRTTTRPNGDMLIYADGGAVLFEGSPRTVTMQPTDGFDSSTTGKAVYVDGVAVTGSSAPMPITAGKLAALSEVRDGVAVKAQLQLDEIAAGLVRSFAESDQSAGSSGPKVQGLFADPAGGLPTAGATPTGIAARLEINPLADPQRGGSPALLRDGGFGGSGYVYNASNVSGYQARISDLIDAVDAGRQFNPAAGLGQTGSLKDFSTQSSAWVESVRQKAQTDSDSSTAARVRSSESLLRVTGVNIDQEMASLLDLEKSYQASSKIVSVVNSMLSTLIQAVG